MFTMIPNVLKNLFYKKATRRYPYTKREPFERSRGMLENEIEKCSFCSICAIKCPSQCITVDKKAAVWQCDPFACVYCGICADNCPEGALHQIKAYRLPVYEQETISLKGK